MLATYDRESVRAFAIDLTHRMERCDNGEGTQCATLEDILRLHADLCYKYHADVRAWAREVFTGRIPFDTETDQLFRAAGERLYNRSVSLYEDARTFEQPCCMTGTQATLSDAIWRLHPIVTDWTSPLLAVGPSARYGLTESPAVLAAIRERLDALPPLPADWQPLDPEQQARFRMMSRQ